MEMAFGVKKLERFFLASFLFFIPFQARIFLHSFSLNFSEWTSAWLWLSDVLLLSVLLLWVLGSDFKAGNLKPLLLLLLFLPSLVLRFNFLSFWFLLKFAEGLLLYCYARNRRGKIFGSRVFVFSFIAGVLANALVGLTQFAVQGSLGLGFLGESLLGGDIAGVAKINVGGAKIIRAYGLTPHPNVLAAFLVAALGVMFIFYLRLFSRKNIFKMILSKAVWVFAFFVLEAALLLTFSREGWAAMGVFVILAGFFILFKKSLRQEYAAGYFRFLAVFIASFFILASPFWKFIAARGDILSGQSFDLRVFYLREALKIFREHPFFGVGFGQFVPELIARNPGFALWQSQPVHNIWVLLVAENGLPVFIILLFAFCFLLFKSLRRFAKESFKGELFSLGILCLAGALFIFSLSDHFLLTLQQGRLLLWFSLGLLPF